MNKRNGHALSVQFSLLIQTEKKNHDIIAKQQHNMQIEKIGLQGGPKMDQGPLT